MEKKSTKTAYLVAVVVIIALLAFLGTSYANKPIIVEDAETPFAGTFWSLLPPICAIALALISKEVYSSLFFGCLIGALLYTQFRPWETILALVGSDYGLLSVLCDSWNMGIIIFLVELGIISDLMNKGGGSAKSGKLKVEVGEKTYEKSFDKDNKSCTISIDNEYLMPDSVFKVTLAAEPDDKCAYLKDVRTDYNGSAGVGTKDRVISSSTDDDIHVMKKTEHKYNVTMAELLLNGKQNIDKVQFATDLEKGMKIKVDKTDTEKFEGCSTKIRYKLNGE